MNAELKKKSTRGYMYIGHLPHGFYEKEIKSYFSQFGKVFRLRLARSKKTGNYKGFGFVEFESEKVAKIAADTMNNYLMFNKLLKCQVISPDKLHPECFKNSKKIFRVPVKSLFRKKYNSPKSKVEIKKANLKIEKLIKTSQAKLDKLSIGLNLASLMETTEKFVRVKGGISIGDRRPRNPDQEIKIKKMKSKVAKRLDRKISEKKKLDERKKTREQKKQEKEGDSKEPKTEKVEKKKSQVKANELEKKELKEKVEEPKKTETTRKKRKQAKEEVTPVKKTKTEKKIKKESEEVVVKKTKSIKKIEKNNKKSIKK